MRLWQSATTIKVAKRVPATDPRAIRVIDMLFAEGAASSRRVTLVELVLSPI
jgi:hypothetical protein